MLIPVGSGLFLLELFHVEAVLDRATQLAGLDHDVQYDAEGQRMQFLNHPPRIRKHRGVESKRAMTGVPARRAEAGAQVDQRITRELLLAECPRYRQDLLTARQRAMGLLVAQRPQRRHLGESRQSRVLRHDLCWIARRNDEKVEWKRRVRSARIETTFLSAEVEGSRRVVNEHRPTARSDQPLDRQAPAVRSQHVSALSASHAVQRAAAIELRAALPEAEQRLIAQKERQRTGLAIEAEMLHQAPIPSLDMDGQRIGREFYRDISALDSFLTDKSSEARPRRIPGRVNE